jgi:hypothetical protein
MEGIRMKNKIAKNQNQVSKNAQGQNTVEVLYQKMGDRWFAFSLINDEVFVGSIPASEITQGNGKAEKKAASEFRSARDVRRDKFSGNS